MSLPDLPRENLEEYLLSICFFVLLCLAFALWRRRRPVPQSLGFAGQTLEKAMSQGSTFRLRFAGRDESVAATLSSLQRGRLQLQIAGQAPASGEVEALFGIAGENGEDFFRFTSRVLSGAGAGQISLAMPDHIEVEKKRHFARVRPAPDSVRAMGLWRLDPDHALPEDSSALGAPLAVFKAGQGSPDMWLENISGAGMAVMLSARAAERAKDAVARGSQLLCLTQYLPPDGQGEARAFWCSAEVMNARPQGENLLLGLEFTNWALLEPGSHAMRWSHSSPLRGVKPVLQWIGALERGKEPD